MKLNRIVAYLIGCIALASTYFVYMDYIYMLGFPDGSITELGYAQRRLARIFIGISIVLGACFIYLGVIAGRKKIGKKLSVAIILYAISIIIVYLVDSYYRSHLMDGTGG
jgi:asparagine N-glycosylation enzyme membrane subunit Stt3